MRALFKTEAPALDRLRLAPETRLGLTLTTSVAALIVNAHGAVICLLTASLIYLLLQVRLKVILQVYFGLSLMAGIAVGCACLMGFVFPAMRTVSLDAALIPFARLGIAVNMVLPLSLHTRLSDLVNTLNRLRMPGVLKLPLLVIVRFIPTFLNDLSQLRQVVRLRFRGRGGLRFWGVHPLLWWRGFFMPLVVRLIRSADELAVAAELKGLSAETDFGRPPLSFRFADRAAMVIGVLTLLGTAFLQVTYAAG